MHSSNTLDCLGVILYTPVKEKRTVSISENGIPKWESHKLLQCGFFMAQTSYVANLFKITIFV